jgi:hypothetical protein
LSAPAFQEIQVMTGGSNCRENRPLDRPDKEILFAPDRGHYRHRFQE